MKANQLLGRKVALDPTKWIANEEWKAFLADPPGTIEAVSYEKESRTNNPYYVLVRNRHGATIELPLGYLLLEEKQNEPARTK